MKELSFPMIIQSSYITNAIEHNDVDATTNLLELICPKDISIGIADCNIFIVVLMLEYASASQGAMLLSDQIAKTLIDHLAIHINFGNFLQLFLRRCRVLCPHNLERIDPELIGAITTPKPYAEELARKIKSLDRDQFVTLMQFIVDTAISRTEDFIIDVRYLPVFMHYIYGHELIPRECVLAYMRMCL